MECDSDPNRILDAISQELHRLSKNYGIEIEINDVNSFGLTSFNVRLPETRDTRTMNKIRLFLERGGYQSYYFCDLI